WHDARAARPGRTGDLTPGWGTPPDGDTPETAVSGVSPSGGVSPSLAPFHLTAALFAVERRDAARAGAVAEDVDRRARHVEDAVEHEQHDDGFDRQADGGQDDPDCHQRSGRDPGDADRGHEGRHDDDELDA